MANIIEVSNQAYEARDQAQMEIAAIQQADAKETQEYEEQMQVLAKKIEEDRRKRDMLGRSDPFASADAEQSSTAAANKAQQGSWNQPKSKATAQASIEKVQSYEEAFNKIKASTGISDIQELVDTFIANEDQNFSLFNYVNEQNNEIEKLEEQIAAAAGGGAKVHPRIGRRRQPAQAAAQRPCSEAADHRGKRRAL